jgi:hypothetical protein
LKGLIAMHNDQSSSNDSLAARCANRDPAGTCNNAFASKGAPEQHSRHPTEKNPPKPFRAKRIDLTSESEGMNVGYVGGVRMATKKSKPGN